MHVRFSIKNFRWDPANVHVLTPATFKRHHQLHNVRKHPCFASSTNSDLQKGDIPGQTVSNAHDNVECLGTGLDVSCVVYTDEEVKGQSANGQGAERQSGEGTALSAAALLLLISPFFFWGTSMVAMKALEPHTTPLFVSAVRLLPAGALLVGWATTQNRKQPSGVNAWFAISLFALADATCFQGFLAEGLQRTSAGLGSVIIDSQPLTVALLASIFFGERLSRLGAAGLVLGVFGLCLLEVPPDLLTSPSFGGVLGEGGIPGAAWSLWDSGEWWMLLAAQSMAVGTVLVPWVSRFVDPIMATGYHMLLGGLPLLALSASREAPELAARLPGLTGLDGALLLYISVLGSAASYGVFFYNASRGNLTTLSSLTFLTPMFAAATGFVFLGETLTPLQLFGATVTLGAVTLLNSGGAKVDTPEKGA